MDIPAWARGRRVLWEFDAIREVGDASSSLYSARLPPNGAYPSWLTALTLPTGLWVHVAKVVTIPADSNGLFYQLGQTEPFGTVIWVGNTMIRVIA
jgi:hypothetical protein